MTVERWADGAMFASEPMPFDVKKTGPKVTLLNATPRPLAAIAAMSKMYEGKAVHNLSEVTEEECHHYFEQMMKTHLKAPLESVSLHFMIEGVTRSFTHQMVRQRTAVYAQESMRFAVKEDGPAETPYPPSLMNAEPDDPRLLRWNQAIASINEAYMEEINLGMPAEEARGLLPHQTTTRLHYVTNLRGLLEHGGNRLCTQAQFEWKAVWFGIIDAIANYETDAFLYDNWQFQEIAKIFRPICYLTGKCEFASVMDRNCSIRARVNANHDAGRPSTEWATEYQDEDALVGAIVSGVGPLSVIRADNRRPVFIGAIDPAEWLTDPMAAR